VIYPVMKNVSDIVSLVCTGKVEPGELEVFYDAWRNILDVNKHAQMLAGFRGVEVNTQSILSLRCHDLRTAHTEHPCVL